MTGISLTSRIDLSSVMLRERMAQLGEQISTGRKGNSYAALGTEAPKSMDFRAEIGRRETYQEMIDQVLSKVQVTQNVLDRLGSIAEKFRASAVKLSGVVRSEEIQIQSDQAKAALVEVANLLNERYGGEYLFGGSDTHNPPIPDADSIVSKPGGMVDEIIKQVGLLNGANTASVLTATKGLAQSNAAGITPFSDFLSTGAGATEGRRNLLAGDNERVEYGIHANKNGSVVSVGETTGSWARDLLRGLASIAGLTPEKGTQGQGYTDFVTNVQRGLEASVDALALQRGSLGVTEKRLQSIQTLHGSVTTSLTLQISDLEEVDMAKTITSFQATQTQLEASYRAISIAQQLSLTRFL
jgi:flagellin-like hook-associated protein FlgL